MKAEGITPEVRYLINTALNGRAYMANWNDFEKYGMPPNSKVKFTKGDRECVCSFIAQAQRLRNRERQRRLAERAKLQAEIERMRREVATLKSYVLMRGLSDFELVAPPNPPHP